MGNKSKFFDPLAIQVAGGSTIRDGAATVRCSLSAAYAISCTPEFRQRVSEIRKEITFRAVGLLSNGATAAAATLVELTSAENEPSIRLQASKAILASLPVVSEFGEIRARIDSLEASSMPRLAQ